MSNAIFEPELINSKSLNASYYALIMVIELSGVQFGHTKFNYHFITSILKSQNLVSTNILLIE